MGTLFDVPRGTRCMKLMWHTLNIATTLALVFIGWVTVVIVVEFFTP